MIVWIRYLSLKKLLNLIKIYLSYSLSILTKKPIIWGYPYSLTTEPTNHCNLNCIECPTGNQSTKRIKGFMEFELYKKIIDEVKNFTFYHMIYFQGEPFIHPKLFEYIKYADQNRIYTCTSSNGHFLSSENCEKIIRSGLKKIIISLDGIDQESYEKYRVGGDYQKVINGIKTLVAKKAELNTLYPKIHLQFLVFKHNEKQIKEIKKISRKLKVDKIELKSAQFENLTENSHLLPTIEKFSRYSKSDFSIKSKLQNKCFRIWSTAVVSFEGILIPCCFDKNLEFKLGDLNSSKIKSLWKSPLFNEFRKNILIYRKKVANCRNCSEGLRIKY